MISLKLNQLILALLFSLISHLCTAQIKIDIENQEIDDLSVINVCLENNEVIKNAVFKSVGKSIFIEGDGYNKIRLSYIGYYDTTLVIKNFSEYHIISLRPKITELDEVIVRNIELFTHVDKRKNKNKTMLFALEENTIWYFDINLSALEVHKLYEVNLELKNICREDKIEISLYENFIDAVNLMPFHKDTVALNTLKNNKLLVFDHKKIGLNITQNFIVGLKIIPIKINRPTKPTSVVTAFQEKETQIYYQKEKETIYKMPNEHYLKYFNAYPILVKTIKYSTNIRV